MLCQYVMRSLILEWTEVLLLQACGSQWHPADVRPSNVARLKR